MADGKIFKPRRGKKSTMTGAKASTILAAGELFVEVPESGVGTGAGKLKMGDGTRTYANLPYLMGDTSNDKITFSANTRSTVATALNDVTSGSTLATIIGALKQAISLINTNITNHTHDDRYFFKSEVETLIATRASSGHVHDSRYYTETEIDTKLSSLRNSFQDGCDLIVEAVTAKGQIPASNSPSDIAAAIGNISTEINTENMNVIVASWGGNGPWALGSGQTSTKWYKYTSTIKGTIIFKNIFNGGKNSGGSGYYTESCYKQKASDNTKESIGMEGTIDVEVGDILYWSKVGHVTTPSWTQLDVSGSATIIELPE